MRLSLRQALRRHTSWVPALLVFATVAAAGSRLVVLSLQQHAEQARGTAQGTAARSAQAIERQIDALAMRAASRHPSKPDFNVFEWASDGSVLALSRSDPAVAKAIVSDWQAALSPRRAPSAAVLGPVREGSEWLIAARAPLDRPMTPDSGPPGGWTIAYESLDRLLARARLLRAVGAGNDFALVRTNREGGYSQAFVDSGSGPLRDPVVRLIHAPPGFAFISPGALKLEIRPHEGWYPTRMLATDIGLLALVAWLLTFIAHDVTHRTSRLRVSLATTRRQLHAAQQKLVREIEEREGLQQSVDRARFHDAFTGLPNRYYFMEQLDRVLRARRDRRLCVFLIAIDRFQLINETLGHTAGDELMVQAGRRFQKAVSAASSVLARWGGDQFALLVRDLRSADDAPRLAAELQAVLQEPFELRRHRLGITARIGLSCLESWPQRAEQLMQEADVALSVARRQEDIACVTYSPSMGGDAASLVSLEADLHVALERQQLKLLFQPIVALRGRHVVGAEALLRWLHPIEGLLRPDRFLSIAEESGIIVPITRWTIHTVCVLASEWRRRLAVGTDFYLTINLSAAVLRDPGLSDYVSDQLAEMAVPPQALKFELTEGGLISNVVAARETLERLHQTGVELMLDDFGTGYSSLNHLQLFPFDYVKIDRPWVGAGASQHGGMSLASAMVQLASSLGLTPIAEVVESQATADALEAMGCHFGQGNFFCAPVESEDALQCLGADRGGVLSPGQLEEDDSPTLILPAGFITEGEGEEEEEEDRRADSS
ncbi:MAG: putative bifunctional diguanylate cyclase/phosphodiesterase [Steroidobacteraceae bacterium]